MTLEISKQLMGLEGILYSYKTGKIADPYTTLEADGSKKGKEYEWTCNDWITFHKTLVVWFKAGRFAPGPYTQANALERSNDIFKQHWYAPKTVWQNTKLLGCGLDYDFVTYFNSVGLKSLFNSAQKIIQGGKDTGGDLLEIASDTTKATAKALKTGVDVVGNTLGVGKYIVPVAVGGVVLLVGAYLYKNFIKGNSRIKAYGVEI